MKPIVCFLLLFVVSLPIIAQPDNGWRPLGKQGMLGAHVLGFTQAKGGDMLMLSRQTVYRSTNMGGQWYASNKGLPYGKDSVFCITSNKNGDVFIGTVDGVYRSLDTGNTWQLVTNKLGRIAISTIFPDTTGVLLAGAFGRMLRSTDNGNTWTEVALDIPTDYKKGVPQFVYSFNDGLKVTFGSWYFQSFNQGATWKNLTSASDPNVYFSRVMAYDTKSTIEARIEYYNGWVVFLNRNSDSLKVGFDLGYFWSFVGTKFYNQLFPFTNDNFYSCFGFVGKDSVLMGSYSHGIHKISCCKYCKNDSNNQTGRFVNSGLKNLNVTTLFKASNGWFFCGTRGGGVYYSTNNGEYWNEANTGLTEPTVNSFLIPSTGNPNYYAATAAGIYVSSDSARTWKRSISGLDNYAVLTLELTNKGTVLAGTQNGIYRSTNKGVSWQKVVSPSERLSYSETPPTPMLAITDFVNFKNGMIICSAYGGLVYASKDDGINWEKRKNLFEDADEVRNFVMEMSVDSSNGMMYLATGKNLLYSKDTGKTYIDYFLDISLNSVVYSANRKLIYACGEDNILYKEVDPLQNQTTDLTADLKGAAFPEFTANSIKTDPLNHLMLATATKGAYFFDNKGQSWKQWNKGLPDGDLLNFVQDDKYYLYACTANNGIYISEKPTAMLEAPVLVNPKHDSTDAITDITFTWKQVVNAQKYHLQISKDSSFASPAFDVQQILTTNKAVSLQNGVTYYWRVRGTMDGLIGQWSEIRTLSTLAILPEKPVLKSPVNDSILPTTAVQFEWNQSKRTDSYTIQYSTDSTFTNAKNQITGVKILSQSTTTVQPQTVYYWRVQGVNTIGVGEWSDVWKFTTGSSTEVSEEETAQQILIIPQPSSNDVSFVTPNATISMITMYNVNGTVVLRSESSVFNIQSLSNGIYNCDVTLSNGVQIRKRLVIIR